MPNCQEDCQLVCARMSKVYGKEKHWSIYERNQWRDPQKVQRWAGQVPSMATLMKDNEEWKPALARNRVKKV